MGFWYWFALIVAIAGGWAWSRRRVFVVQEFESGLLYHEGRFQYATGPGREVFWRPNYQMTYVDLRRRQLIVDSKEILTSDHIAMQVSLQMTFKVADAVKATHETDDFQQHIYAAAQQAVRSAVGQVTGEALLENRTLLGETLREVTQTAGTQIGLEVIALEVRDLTLHGSTKKAIADLVAARVAQEQELAKAAGDTTAVTDNDGKSSPIRNMQLLELLGNLSDSQVKKLIKQLEAKPKTTASPRTKAAPAKAAKSRPTAISKKKAKKAAKRTVKPTKTRKK